MAITVRGTGIQSASASTFTVSWPAGTIAGDTAIIFAGHGCTVNALSGWTSIDNLSGSWWNGAIFSKSLTAADITAGSATITAGCSFNGVVGIITLSGGGDLLVATLGASQRNPSPGATSITLTSSVSTVSGNLNIYWGSNRAAATDTINRGTLQQQINAANASGCIYTETGASGAISATFGYSPGGDGNYEAIVIVSVLVVTAPAFSAGGGGGGSITLRDTEMPAGALGSAYSQTLTAQGGTGPYTFAVITGALPSGLTLNSSTGVISGAPAAAGTSTFTITATDSTRAAGSQSFSIVITPGGSVRGNYSFVG